MKIETPAFAEQTPTVKEAIRIANLLLAGEEAFYQKIREVQAFAFSTNHITGNPVSGEEIAPLLAQDINVAVRIFKPLFKCSKEFAHTTPGIPVISLNKYKLNRGIDEIAAVLIHECVHIVDVQKDLSFSHSDKYVPGTENSAPYRIQQIALKIITP